MIYLFVLAVLGCTFSCASSFFTDRVYNSTLGWSLVRHIHRSPPLVVQSSGRSLIHVLDTDESLRLVSLDFKTCNLPLNLSYPLRYPRRAVTLGNGKIVVWFLNYMYVKSYHEGEWRFFIIDPTNCDYHGFKIPERDPSLIDIVDVVGYEDTFDIFIMYPSEDEGPRKIYVFRKIYGDDGNFPADFISHVYQGETI